MQIDRQGQGGRIALVVGRVLSGIGHEASQWESGIRPGLAISVPQRGSMIANARQQPRSGIKVTMFWVCGAGLGVVPGCQPLYLEAMAFEKRIAGS
ncbi:hypothetical protein AA102526_0919 [Asaia lannensis NBRC 102526]|nr:hypothetical protein AA102526_0919 [Asaia lannensis NBRC 102526]